jgi:hypothetical protein
VAVTFEKYYNILLGVFANWNLCPKEGVPVEVAAVPGYISRKAHGNGQQDLWT